jgi:hypothetical protein
MAISRTYEMRIIIMPLVLATHIMYGFRRVRIITKSDYQLRPVRPPVGMEQLVSQYTDFYKSLYASVFYKIYRENPIFIKIGENDG